MTVMSLFSQFLHSTLSRPPIFIIYLLMPFMAHEYVLYVTFVVSKFVLRHPNRDASKNMSAPTISEFYEIYVLVRFRETIPTVQSVLSSEI